MTDETQQAQTILEELDQALVRHRLERAGRPREESCAIHAEIGRRLLEALAVVRMQPRTVLDSSPAAASIAPALEQRFSKASIVSLDAAWHPFLATPSTARSHWWSAPRTRIVCANQAALPLKDTSVDLVTSNLALHRRLHPDPFLLEFQRVLSAGGLLMLTTFGPDTLKELRAAWRLVDQEPHIHPFADMHDVGDALMRAGFTDVVMNTERLTCHYPDVKTVHSDLRCLGVGNANVNRPRSLRTPRQLSRLTNAYESLRERDGLPVTLEVVYAHAWRPAARAVSVPVSFT